MFRAGQRLPPCLRPAVNLVQPRVQVIYVRYPAIFMARTSPNQLIRKALYPYPDDLVIVTRGWCCAADAQVDHVKRFNQKVSKVVMDRSPEVRGVRRVVSTHSTSRLTSSNRRAVSPRSSACRTTTTSSIATTTRWSTNWRVASPSALLPTRRLRPSPVINSLGGRNTARHDPDEDSSRLAVASRAKHSPDPWHLVDRSPS